MTDIPDIAELHRRVQEIQTNIDTACEAMTRETPQGRSAVYNLTSASLACIDVMVGLQTAGNLDDDGNPLEKDKVS